MKIELTEELRKIEEKFKIPNEKLDEIATNFYNDMKEKSMLKMLNSYVVMNTDNVNVGDYLAIDVGGSNVRICKINVEENSAIVEKMLKFPLRTEDKNYTSKEYTLKDLILKALKLMEPFLDKEKTYSLGATISFELDSTSTRNAKILSLSKGFELSDTAGRDIYDILTEAISEFGYKIVPNLIVNDCVATLATGMFYNNNADMALIVGTGHNACFKDEKGELINIESACFNKDLPLTEYDKEYISKIPKEAEKLFEVLIGGKYINGPANIIMNHLIKKGLMEECETISTADMSNILNGNNVSKYNDEQRDVINEIAQILFRRAARLIVAEIKAILMTVDKSLAKKHVIIFDGSVYEKCDFFRDEISKNIENVFLENSMKLSHKLQKDASTVGPSVILACL